MVVVDMLHRILDSLSEALSKNILWILIYVSMHIPQTSAARRRSYLLSNSPNKPMRQDFPSLGS